MAVPAIHSTDSPSSLQKKIRVCQRGNQPVITHKWVGSVYFKGIFFTLKVFLPFIKYNTTYSKITFSGILLPLREVLAYVPKVHGNSERMLFGSSAVLVFRTRHQDTYKNWIKNGTRKLTSMTFVRWRCMLRQ